MTPTIQQKRAFVREEIIKAVPEILELKFGCDIEHSVSEEFNIPYQGVYLHPARGKGMHLIFFKCSAEGSQRDYSTTINQKDFKILGRPITLADFLRTIGKKNEWGVSVDAEGIFNMRSPFDSVQIKKKYAWNLSINFDHQPDPFVVSSLWGISIAARMK